MSEKNGTDGCRQLAAEGSPSYEMRLSQTHAAHKPTHVCRAVLPSNHMVPARVSSSTAAAAAAVLVQVSRAGPVTTACATPPAHVDHHAGLRGHDRAGCTRDCWS